MKTNTLKSVALVGFSVMCAGNIASAEVPQMPASCNGDRTLCSSSSVVGDGFVAIRIGVKVPKTRVRTPADFMAKYFDFGKWPAYAQGSDNLKYALSVELSPIQEHGKVIRRQYSNYSVKSPWPINRTQVRAVSLFEVIQSPGPDVLTAISFKIIREGRVDVPAGEKPLEGAEGLKDQFGTLKLYDLDAGHWLAFLELNSKPAISILPSLAAPYIENATLDLIRGMSN